jgi:hypothetical protein
MEEASKVKKETSVSIRGIIKKDANGETNGDCGIDLFEKNTTVRLRSMHEKTNDEIEPPPLI